ncbi:MAG: hypothetical protein WBK77_00530 [Alphaproteobacteria bacterium]
MKFNDAASDKLAMKIERTDRPGILLQEKLTPNTPVDALYFQISTDHPLANQMMESGIDRKIREGLSTPATLRPNGTQTELVVALDLSQFTEDRELYEKSLDVISLLIEEKIVTATDARNNFGFSRFDQVLSHTHQKDREKAANICKQIFAERDGESIEAYII